MITHSIVIPCYNEELRLNVSAFQKHIKERSDIIFCFVNDGSTDNTLQTLQLLQTIYPERVFIIDNKSNLGKSESVRRGVLRMMEINEIEYFGFIDADLSTDLEQYSEMLVSIKNSCQLMIFATRNCGKGKDIKYSPFRYFAGRIARMLIKEIIKLPIDDTQCGAKIFSREAAWICFKIPFDTRWLFDVEIFLRLKQILGNDEIIHRITAFDLQKWKQVANSRLRVVDMLQTPFLFVKIMIRYKVNPLK